MPTVIQGRKVCKRAAGRSSIWSKCTMIIYAPKMKHRTEKNGGSEGCGLESSTPKTAVLVFSKSMVLVKVSQSWSWQSAAGHIPLNMKFRYLKLIHTTIIRHLKLKRREDSTYEYWNCRPLYCSWSLALVWLSSLLSDSTDSYRLVHW